MIPYDNFKYLWPPRPDNSVLPGLLSFYETKGWIGQVKKNGACTLWAVSPDKKITVMNRHNDYHKSWEPNSENIKPFLDLPDKWYVFALELLHMKTPNIKDTLYIFDILVSENTYMIGQTFRDRYAQMPFKYTGEAFDHSKVNDKVWVAKNFDIGFENLYNQLTDVADEGVVLKNPKAILEPCMRQQANNHWLVKCRKGHKNYGF